MYVFKVLAHLLRIPYILVVITDLLQVMFEKG
jgi:hypothetical protein